MFEHKKPRYPVDEFCSLTGLSRPTFYRRVKEGLVQVQKDGHRSFIIAAELDRYLQGCATPAAT